MFSISKALPRVITVLIILSSWHLKYGVLPSSGRKVRFDWTTVKYVYAFGDSYSFVGGTEGFPDFRFVALVIPCDFIVSPQREIVLVREALLAVLRISPSHPSRLSTMKSYLEL